MLSVRKEIIYYWWWKLSFLSPTGFFSCPLFFVQEAALFPLWLVDVTPASSVYALRACVQTDFYASIVHWRIHRHTVRGVTGPGTCSVNMAFNQNKKVLQRAVRVAECVIGTSLTILSDICSDIYSVQLQKAANCDLKHPTHPGHHPFSLRMEGRGYRVIISKINKLKNSFFTPGNQMLKCIACPIRTYAITP